MVILSRGGGRVHNLRMDGGLPSAAWFSRSYPLLITSSCCHTHFYDECWWKTPIFDNFLPISENPPMFKETLPKKGPLFREFWTHKPTHMGGTYPYTKHVVSRPPGSFASQTLNFATFIWHERCCWPRFCLFSFHLTRKE